MHFPSDTSSSIPSARTVRCVAFAIVLALAPIGAAPPAHSQTLDRIRGEAKLRLGYLLDARPFSYRDEQGRISGYTVAVCQRIAKDIERELNLDRLEVELVQVGSEDRFDALTRGEIDLLCGAPTVTLKRRQIVSFSIPIFPSGIGALVRSQGSERLQDVLEGRQPVATPKQQEAAATVFEKTILSAEAGTTAESWLRSKRYDFRIEADVVTVRSHEEGVDRVLDQRSDVLFGDRAILLDVAARSTSANALTVVARVFSYEPVALGLPRNDADLRLLVDRSLSRLYRSEEIHEIYEKFFGPPDADARSFFRWMALPD